MDELQKRAINKSLFLFIVLLLSSVLYACESSTPSSAFAIAPNFENFYLQLGGKSNLGLGISPIFKIGGISYQYTAACLMVFDPLAPESDKYSIAPLGIELLQKGFINNFDEDDPSVYQPFKEMYTNLGGEKIVGKPLSPAFRDPSTGRTIQYFENLGFYQFDSDSVEVVHLLAYGEWKCAESCDFNGPLTASPIVSSIALEALSNSRIDEGLFGSVLADPQIGFDGLEETIYQNVVVVFDSERPAQIRLRNLSKILNIQGDLLEYASDDPEAYFRAVDGSMGFNIPIHFWEVIMQNSGFEFFGEPISRYAQLGDGLYRQCFENACLDYYPDAEEGEKVSLAPLGYNYQKWSQQDENSGGVNNYKFTKIVGWETYPLIASGKIQTITVFAYEDQQPVENVPTLLSMTLPDGSQDQYEMAPTNDEGISKTDFTVPQVPINSLISYQLCIFDFGSLTNCIYDEFTVWEPGN